MGRMWLI